MRFKLIAFDLNTLSECGSDNSWQLIREAFGIPNLWEKYKAGYISREGAMKGEYELWRQKRVKRKKILKLINERYNVADGARILIRDLKKNKIKVAIISDGPELAVKHIAKKLGITEYACNEIIFDSDEYAVETKPTHPSEDMRISKPDALKAIASKHRIPLEQCVAVGNDMEDAEMFRIAGFSIAVNPKDDELNHIASVVVYNLSEASNYLV